MHFVFLLTRPVCTRSLALGNWCHIHYSVETILRVGVKESFSLFIEETGEIICKHFRLRFNVMSRSVSIVAFNCVKHFKFVHFPLSPVLSQYINILSVVHLDRIQTRRNLLKRSRYLQFIMLINNIQSARGEEKTRGTYSLKVVVGQLENTGLVCFVFLLSLNKIFPTFSIESFDFVTYVRVSLRSIIIEAEHRFN